MKKEKVNVEAAKGSAEELKQAFDAAKVAKKDLVAKVNLAEARVKQLETQNKLALDNFAIIVAQIEEKINAGRDDTVDLTMYRVWEHNQGIDISFMRDEAECLLKNWKARLKEEKELHSITASEALSKDDEAGKEASSLGSKIPRTPAMLAAEIRAVEEQVNKDIEPAVTSAEPPSVEDTPAIQT